jgi:hypothetical protein
MTVDLSDLHRKYYKLLNIHLPLNETGKNIRDGAEGTGQDA